MGGTGMLQQPRDPGCLGEATEGPAPWPTGVYWINLFGVLGERGFQVMLVDPRRIKNVPGPKTDVLDCQWLQQLHTYGLLWGVFRPEDEIRRLRSYLRQRAMLVEHAAQHMQRRQKALTPVTVKLHHLSRDITGKTGKDIIKAIERPGGSQPHQDLDNGRGTQYNFAPDQTNEQSREVLAD